MKQLAYYLLSAIAWTMLVFVLFGLQHNPRVVRLAAPPARPASDTTAPPAADMPMETIGHLGSYRMHANGAREADDGL